ncbi:MAG TPA: hypothetical protein VIH26_07225 [Anaerolineales bacterium]
MSVYAEQLRQVGGAAGRVRPLVGLLRSERDRVFTLIMLGALVTFELFNFSTTEFALKDLLGGLRLGTAQWATILAFAFSAVDFAGVAWLFTPKQGARIEAWYLVGAWLLAATMNAILTWWSVSLALLQHESLGNEIIARETLLSSAPVFVAGLIWLLRVLLIGSFTLATRRPVGAEILSPVAAGPAAPSPSAGRSARRTLIVRPIRQR